jgi:hypothetical protein
LYHHKLPGSARGSILDSYQTKLPVDLISATAVAAGIITLSEMGDKEWTVDLMYNDDDGSEVLRLIVKDDILGAADHIVDALWWCVFPTK